MFKGTMAALLAVLMIITSISVPVSSFDGQSKEVKEYGQSREIIRENKYNDYKVFIEDEFTYREIVRFQKTWKDLVSTGDLYVDYKGHIAVRKNNVTFGEKNSFFKNAIDACNEAIESGLIIVNPTSMTISEKNKKATKKETHIFNVMREMKIKYTDMDSFYSNYSERNKKKHASQSSHGCGLRQLDLLFIASKNYAEVKNYYSYMFALAVSSPNSSFNPFTCTVVFWINKVKEGGEWDYKSREGYSPWNKEFCTYYDGATKHITSEFLGNFNFGYTGKYLFSLSELHSGSFAVSGFSTSDYDDWPAIDDGYNHAP